MSGTAATPPTGAWPRASRVALPATDEVVVVRARLAECAGPASVVESLLTPEERARMRRFARADDRDRARSGCVLVRRLLAPWLGVPPGQIELRAGVHGKPALAPGAHPPLEFNLSHAGAWVLAAAAHGRAVGVDVEALGDLPLEELQSMAVLVFSPAEQAAWSRLGADEQRTAFYRLWARKEAYLKGTGMGIADGLEHATLGLDVAEARLISDTRAPEAPTRWHIRPLDVYPGYEGAVALALHHPLEAVRIRTLEVGPDFFLHPT